MIVSILMGWLRFKTISLLLTTACFLIPSTLSALLLSEHEEAWLNEHRDEIYFAPIKDFPPYLWSQYGTRDEILTALQMGESSFVSTLTSTPERTEYLLFTRPYLSMPTVYVGRSGTKIRTGLEIVQNKYRVSVGDNYGAHNYLRERYPDMILVPEENNYFVLQNILTGVTEIGVINIATLAHLVREYNFENLKKIADTGFELKLSFAVPKSMPELRNILDNVIETMPKKTKEAIVSKWITDTATIENLAGTPVADLRASSDKKESYYYYIAGMAALLLLCVGFILHYIFVRSTPRKGVLGKEEYVP